MKKVKTKKIIKLVVWLIILAVVAAGVLKFAPIVVGGYRMYKNAFDEEAFLEMVDDIRSSDGYVTIDEISTEYTTKLVSVEDHRFYYHFGIDPIAICRAVSVDIMCGRIVEGGSTITQQLAKILLFTHDQTYERKVAEVFASTQIERLFTKDEILELYCNVIYYGEDCYGIYNASEHYYDILPSQLDAEEAAAMVRTIRSPNTLNPNCA